MGRATQDKLLYDDTCGMCSAQMRVFTRLDWFDTIRLMPLSHPETAELVPDLTHEQKLEAIHCITPRGKIHRAARAFRHLSLRIPLLFPLWLLLWFPGVIWIAEWVYRRVARNRYVISHVFGCTEACSIPQARKVDVDDS
ncbi:MAG: DUF393 domain-containing protein [Acidobacteriota bacterium]|nr:DUF393 domain-containing protein [Acidobacteriota bacterium]MDH3783802.1 DUF393 domain-containing protein [Acidobacteriota bacterium]